MSLFELPNERFGMNKYMGEPPGNCLAYDSKCIFSFLRNSFSFVFSIPNDFYKHRRSFVFIRATIKERKDNATIINCINCDYLCARVSELHGVGSTARGLNTRFYGIKTK